MGWASGDLVFDPVAQTLLNLAAPPEITEAVCTALIGPLRDRGWDTEEESLGAFADHPAIVAAFRTHGIIVRCAEEHPTKPWSCELERDHSAPDHRDESGHHWPKAAPP